MHCRLFGPTSLMLRALHIPQLPVLRPHMLSKGIWFQSRKSACKYDSRMSKARPDPLSNQVPGHLLGRFLPRVFVTQLTMPIQQEAHLLGFSMSRGLRNTRGRDEYNTHIAYACRAER